MIFDKIWSIQKCVVCDEEVYSPFAAPMCEKHNKEAWEGLGRTARRLSKQIKKVQKSSARESIEKMLEGWSCDKTNDQGY